MNSEIHIDGRIETEENPISIDDFNDKFIEWIKNNKWYFKGVIIPYKGREAEFEEKE